MSEQLFTTTTLVSDAITTDKDRYASPSPISGLTVQVVTAKFVPYASASTDAANYRTISLKKGATTLASVTTNSAGGEANTAGTARDFELADGLGKDNEFDTDAGECVEVDSTHAGTGQVADGAVVITWRSVPA